MGSSAVIYARYSSAKQRDVSIDDQLRACRSFCGREGLTIAREYSDRAISGRRNDRPQFQQMIAAAPESDFVVVYSMDRFSRDKYDAPVYKSLLAKVGVQVVSATEHIPDGPEGALMERVIEGIAAYYSLDLARKVKRGMEGNAIKGLYNGYPVFGYSVEDGRYVINEDEAEIVREVYSRYLRGESVSSIAHNLADRGYKTMGGKPASYNMVYRMLRNEKYVGVYQWDQVRIEDGMPQIISRSEFEAASNMSIPKRTSEIQTDYLLTGRLFCGECGCPMRGEAAHGRTKRYAYYGCKNRCRRIRKEVIEGAVSEAVIEVMDDPNTARMIARRIVEGYDGGGSLKVCEQQMKANERAMKNLIDAIASVGLDQGMEKKLAELRRERETLEAEHGRLLAESLNMTEDDIAEFLMHGFAIDDGSLIFDGFIRRVYLFEDFAVATLNFRDETNSLAEIKLALASGSDCIRMVPHSNTCTNIFILHNGIGLQIPIKKVA